MQHPSPKHGARATCRHCYRDIKFWKGNSAFANDRGEWFHVKPVGRGDGAASHPRYCFEVTASPLT